jgi:hypothetical protein
MLQSGSVFSCAPSCAADGSFLVGSWLLEEASWKECDKNFRLLRQGPVRVCVCPSVSAFVAVDRHREAELIGVAHCAQSCGKKGHFIPLHSSGATRMFGKAVLEVGQGCCIQVADCSWIATSWACIKSSLLPKAGVRKRRQPNRLRQARYKTVARGVRQAAYECKGLARANACQLLSFGISTISATLSLDE